MKIRQRLGAVVVSALVVALLGAGMAIAFGDVGPNDDYAEAIEELASLGIITGKPDGNFYPRDPVTRQQFAKMVVLTLDLPVSEANICPFRDVEIGGYSDPFFPDNYIAVAAEWNITRGISATAFNPYANISRAQVMTMVVRAAPMVGVELRMPDAAYYSDDRYTQRTFDDPNHGLNAQIAELNGLLWGIRTDSAGVWDPWKKATRGEVAQILYRLRQKIDTPPTTGTTSTTAPPSDLLFYDDFSDPDSGWPITYEDGWATDYESGAYFVEVSEPDSFVWTVQGDVFSDVVIEVDVFSLELQGSWEYGLIFGLEDQDDYYELSIVGEETAQLWRYLNGQWTQVSDWVELEPLPSDGWRHLEVHISGRSVYAVIDDVGLGPVDAPGLGPGAAGVAVGTFDDDYIKVYFDDFTVWSN